MQKIIMLLGLIASLKSFTQTTDSLRQQYYQQQKSISKNFSDFFYTIVSNAYGNFLAKILLSLGIFQIDTEPMFFSQSFTIKPAFD